MRGFPSIIALLFGGLLLIAPSWLFAQQRASGLPGRGASQADLGRLGRDFVRKYEPLIQLEVRQLGSDVKEVWAAEFKETRPTMVTFRWSTELQDLRWASWRVMRDRDDPSSVVASGDLSVPAPDRVSAFNVDFRTIAKPAPGAVTYWISITGERELRTPDGQTRRVQAWSLRIPITFTETWTPTVFTEGGLRPELLTKLPVSIDLHTLRADGDDDIEPYLLVAAVYIDGTTVRPQVDPTNGTIGFGNSRVRIQRHPRTHGNILGDRKVGGIVFSSMDGGQTVGVPPETGHFETTIQPIGLELTNRFEGDGAKQLRESTYVGLIVIGMEEDAVPSTEDMDSNYARLVLELQTEFARAIRGTTLEMSNSNSVGELVSAVHYAAGTLVGRLEESVKSRTSAQALGSLIYHAGPTIVLAPDIGNADDFIGIDVEIFDYQQLLDAGDSGVAFTLNLSNPDEDVRYEVRGRAGVQN
jgi:hypothetical protein